ncbi:MAG: hypothetical protein BHW00_01775 [Clostridium sp. 26_22]|nr:MAG: hypothetical protein BHW00_01775 [Clostridium sp. 26_22]
MNNIYLSKSRYCKARQCKKIIWLKKYKPEYAIQKARDIVLENGTKVGQLAKGLFGKYENIDFNENLNIMIDQTKKLLKNKPNIITEASFNYNNNFCSVDILKNDIDGVEIYEVKSSTEISDIYLDDVSYQYYILNNLEFNIKKACIVYINNKYVKQGNLELNKLFNIEDVTEIAKSKQQEIENNIYELNKYMEEHMDNEPKDDIGIKCFKPYECEFWEYCTRYLPKPNVFDIKGGMHLDKKFEKYYDGKISFNDLQNENINPKYLEQIDFELNNLQPKIDKDYIKEIIKALNYPLYFLDYETYQVAIPEIDGTRPYQQLPFQYSLHIIKEEGAAIEHKEFLAEIEDKDFIRHFAENLIKDIPDNGSVIIYNRAFEPARNREIAEMYPDLKDELERINCNMIDFLEPFKQRKYYTKEMQGSASIKYVLPALYQKDSELDYHNLPVVHNGEEASEAFLSLKGKSKEKQKEIRNGLLVYCQLDTYAMVKIWMKFKQILSK